MRIPLLDLRRELHIIGPAIQAQWNHLLSHPQFVNGEQVRAFEAEMATFLGVPNVIGVSSGTEALILSLAACGVAEGDEVILPANAFIAALEAVWWLKARPVLVDIGSGDFGPDPHQISQRLTRRTKALLVVHLYGTPIDLDPLLDLCHSSHMHLIEDCSHAHGASYKQRRVGSFGSVGCFSAGVVKNLAALGEAGFIATSDADIVRRLTRLREHGQEGKNNHLCYGTNGRLDELQAAVLRVRLPSLETRNARRREIAHRYNEAFAALDMVLPREDSRQMSVYHQYVIRTPHRDALRSTLQAQGIETGIHYPTPLHLQPAWQTHYGQRLALPHSERAAQEILSLPIFPELTDEEVKTVITQIQAFFQDTTFPTLRRPEVR